jgi:two-component system sensor histidine kinase HydH
VNLLVNAIQAMPHAGGAVRIRATVLETEAGRYARVDVADNGPGMTQEIAARVFEPFFTTRAAGTGLGLPVVKRIVEAHRGRVELRTQPGSGAVFSVDLPLA